MSSPVSNSVCELFKRQIRQGELKVGGIFPSIRAVAEKHHLAHATAVRVVDRLITEGYIERHGRKPAVVRGVPNRSLCIGFAYDAGAANFKHPAAVKLLYALSETSLAHGHRLQLLPIESRNDRHVLDFAREHKVTKQGGILTLGGVGMQGGHEPLTVALRDSGIPLVQLESRLNEIGRIWPLVTPDLAQVGSHAVDIFHQVGRKRIGAIVGPWSNEDQPYSLLRGISLGMREHGCSWSEASYERITEWSERDGQNAAARLLDKGDFNAIVCPDDINAIGVLRELDARGLSAPDDIALVGIGDLLSPHADAQLSTFDLQYGSMVEKAIALLERQADGDNLVGYDATVDPLYISRNTCPDRMPAGRFV